MTRRTLVGLIVLAVVLVGGYAGFQHFKIYLPGIIGRLNLLCSWNSGISRLAA